jgi:acyl dehydratase
VLQACGGIDPVLHPARFKAMEVRFASPVFPGEALRTDMWMDKSSGRVVFEMVAKERQVKVLSNCFAEFHPPQAKL